MKEKIYFTLLVAVLLISIINAIIKYEDCKEQGGFVVRGFVGLECIRGEVLK